MAGNSACLMMCCSFVSFSTSSTGNNRRVNRSTRNTLFDEKMGGTLHLALGNSYPETGGVNHSALYWDMVCDLRRWGEVWVDDTLFLKDGEIVV